MTEKRKKYLEDTYVESDRIDSILSCKTQEIIYVYFLIVRKLKSLSEPDKEYTEKKEIVYRAILASLFDQENIYAAYDKITKKPHIDENKNVWIFTEKSFADKAVEHYIRQFITLDIKKVNKDQFAKELLDYHRMGIERILVDNGAYNVVVHRQDLLNEYDEPIEVKYENPEVYFSALQFMQNSSSIADYPSKKELLLKLEGDMIKKISASMLLVPVKSSENPKLEDGEIREISTAEKVIFSILKNEESDTRWLPAYTDMVELSADYSGDEWNASVLNFAELSEAAKNCDGIIINPSGFRLLINEENQKKIISV